MRKIYVLFLMAFLCIDNIDAQEVTDFQSNKIKPHEKTICLLRQINKYAKENYLLDTPSDINSLNLSCKMFYSKWSNLKQSIDSLGFSHDVFATWFSKDPDDLTPLKGTTWAFTYTIINTYTDTITYGTNIQTTSDGSVALACSSEYGTGFVFYADLPQGGRGFATVIESYSLIEFYSFTIDDNGNTATGYYAAKIKSTGQYSDLYPMIGIKKSGGIITTSTTSTIPQTTTTTTSTIRPTTTTTSIPVPANNPPNTPKNPYPPDGDSGVASDIMLSWDGGDPDGDIVTYDLYFGSGSPVLYKEKLSSNRCEVKGLQPSTTYRWKVIAKDAHGATSQSEIWSFSTIGNSPPQPPPDDAANCPASLILQDDTESLEILRRFRDERLNKTETGKNFIRLYYVHGKAISKSIEDKPVFIMGLKKILVSLVSIIKKIL